MPRTVRTALVALMLALAALLAVADSLSGPTRWTPDGLFYQARALELQGTPKSEALAQTFQGPLAAELRREDPERSGDPAWVAYTARFYERRIAVSAAAAVLEPVSGSRALLDVSLAGYVVAVLALFGLLLLRFRLAVAAGVTLATLLLPTLTHHAALPLTDSWGLALEASAFAFGILTLQRGPHWLAGWVAAIALLSLTRDSSWLPVLAAVWLAVIWRSRISLALAASALAATLPVLLLFTAPTRELLATMLNDAQPAPDASWAFVADRYPGALADLMRADAGFVRDGAWYTAAYLVAGLAALFALARGASRVPAASLLQAAAVAGIAYVLAVPVFSAFRLEVALVPMAAFGLALGCERLIERVRAIQAEGLPVHADPAS